MRFDRSYYRALVCDCDGVLVDSETAALQALRDALAACWPGVDVLPVLRPLLGLQTRLLLTRAAERLQRSLDAAQIESIRAAAERAAHGAPPTQGVLAALNVLMCDGLLLACASNSRTDYVRGVLARHGLEHCFDGRVACADRVARPKPAPDVYLEAARLLQVEPRYCLAVEDSTTGVAAAAAAGMTVFGFVGAGHADDAQPAALRAAGAVEVFGSMAELPARIAARQRLAA